MPKQRSPSNSTRRWRSPALLVGMLLIIGLATPLALAAPDAQDEPVLMIGYLGPASTDAASGAQLAIDQINAAGGVAAPDGTTYQFGLVTLAGPTTSETLASDLATLTQQDISAILGPDTTDLMTPENVQALIATGLPILTGATYDPLTDSDMSDMLIRIRAPERVYSYALATYMTSDLGFTRVAMVQTDIESTEALIAFEGTLTAAGLTPADKIQLPGGSDLIDQTQRLVDANPEAVMMWGPAQDAVTLLRQLRGAGWAGTFAYRNAEEAAGAGILPDDLADGVLGVTSWSYGYPSRASRIFLRDYVTALGDVPGALSAAAYDAVWFLYFAVNEQGTTPDALKAGLVGGSPRTLVQGTLHPVDYANGDLARLAFVYELGPRGGPTVVARYDDTTALPLENAPEVVQAVPTFTPGPPTNTPFPTATLEGTWARVTATVLNVRTGPGFNYDKVGQVRQDDLLRVLAAIPDFTWLTVDFQGTVGWVKTEFVEVVGDLTTVSVVQAPPTPTLGATLTPTLPPNPDIVIDTVVLSPPAPVPNKPFTATIAVRNAGGGAAGQFAVAGTFQPGNVYLATFVGGLAGGQSTQVQLNGTLTGTGIFQVAIVADLNNEVSELNENNNIYNLTYQVDYPLFAQQSGVQLNAGTNWDLFGGTVDFDWDGNNLNMQNGAMIGILSGVTYENANYDMLTPGVVNNGVGLTSDVVNPGVVAGVYIAEGSRAVMRIDNRQGTTIWISYRVYNSSP